jgi:hypothetical protein
MAAMCGAVHVSRTVLRRQAEARRLEQLCGVNPADPFAGMSTPASMHTNSNGSVPGGPLGRYSAGPSLRTGSGASVHSGYPSRMASLNASSSYGVASGPLSNAESLAADADAIQALNHRLASLKRGGGSGEDREAVVGLLQRMLSASLGATSLQSHGSGGSRDFDAEMAGMLAANGSYGHHQSSSPHYGSTGGSMNKFSPDPRVYLASSLYAPSGATSAYQVSPARSRCVAPQTCGICPGPDR